MNINFHQKLRSATKIFLSFFGDQSVLWLCKKNFVPHEFRFIVFQMSNKQKTNYYLSFQRPSFFHNFDNHLVKSFFGLRLFSIS
eukprot:UN15803